MVYSTPTSPEPNSTLLMNDPRKDSMKEALSRSPPRSSAHVVHFRSAFYK